MDVDEAKTPPVEGEGGENGEDSGVEKEAPQDRLLVISNLKHALALPASVALPADEQKAAREQIMQVVTENNIVGFYEVICADLGWEVDSALLATMKAANDAKSAGIKVCVCVCVCVYMCLFGSVYVDCYMYIYIYIYVCGLRVLCL
jgi:hypothetical protein